MKRFLKYALLLTVSLQFISGGIVLCEAHRVLKLKSEEGKKPKIHHWEKVHKSAGLKGIWMNADGTKGWIVGTGGEILFYNGAKWEKEVLGGEVTESDLNAVRMIVKNSKITDGWAVGNAGVILRYKEDEDKKNNKWDKDIDASKLTKNDLTAVWMKADGSEGWAMGSGGIILFYKVGTWSIYAEPGDLTGSDLTAVWMNPDGLEGWAVGSAGAILRYEGSKQASDKTGNEAKKWFEDENASKVENIKKSNLAAIWMKPDGSAGWGVGSGGIILSYREGTWSNRFKQKSDQVTKNDLAGVWMDENGSKGWAVGSKNEILYYNGKEWNSETKRDFIDEKNRRNFDDEIKSSDPITDPKKINLTSLWINRSGTKGWAIGEFGAIQSFESLKPDESPKWQEVVQADSEFTYSWPNADYTGIWMATASGKIFFYDGEKLQRCKQPRKIINGRTYSVCMDDKKSRGWAVGEGGEVFSYNAENGGIYPLSNALINQIFRAKWMNQKGNKGWAIDNNTGEMLSYNKKEGEEEGEWQKYKKEKITGYKFLDLWIKEDVKTGKEGGKTGWAVSNNGDILFFGEEKWQHDNEGSELTEEKLNSIRLNKDGTRGWIVGSGEVILRYSPKDVEDELTLNYTALEYLNNLEGTFSIQSKQAEFEFVSLWLIIDVEKEKSSIPIQMDKDKMDFEKGWSKTFNFSFKNVDGVKETHKKKWCALEVEIKYHQPLPVKAAYQTTKKFPLDAPPGWPVSWWVILAFLAWGAIGIFFVFMAGFCKSFRKTIFDPDFLEALVSLLNIILPVKLSLIVIPPLRRHLFRVHKNSLKDTYANESEKEKISSGATALMEPNKSSEQNCNSEKCYKRSLERMLSNTKKILWVIEANTEEQKARLLKNWVNCALELKKTPILLLGPQDVSFIPGEISPLEYETKVISALASETSLPVDLVKKQLGKGGFYILLDTRNGLKKDFVEDILNNNHVVITSLSKLSGYWKKPPHIVDIVFKTS